ncbi:lytic polysaccharide monooxygenase [Patellaria atrata CBS 101060]|uniref:lytic cellulose monooxygenase (C4-dehydrogenating) n=1 Tax=Patellaria atrata CBS 101060 TaxID=1346257 RepID=A0A9P4SHM5_9PEZI|nr:lytic polysaccharide monooxygenase [Patellaria atrata CBS 101060]
MKTSALFTLASSSGVFAHYSFGKTISNGVTSTEWEFVRMTTNHWSSAPVENVSDPQIRCYEAATRDSAKVLTVAAGSKFGFKSNNSMGHPGPILFYMAKVPAGQDVTTWDGSGAVWFKISQSGSIGTDYPQFETNMSEFFTTIPAALPSGQYLIRGEHIGLHIAGKPQFYLACAQVSVTGGGSGRPTNLVSFPGAYSMSDPGLSLNIYSAKGPYTYPGPPLWTGR